MSVHNGLDPEVEELLVILSEECGEVAQRVGKILRHGFQDNPYSGIPNKTSLQAELTDIYTIVFILDMLNTLSTAEIFGNIRDKIKRLRRPGILHASSDKTLLFAKIPCSQCGSLKFFLKDGPGGVDDPRCIGNPDCNS